jgi:hypothetical protein
MYCIPRPNRIKLQRRRWLLRFWLAQQLLVGGEAVRVDAPSAALHVPLVTLVPLACLAAPSVRLLPLVELVVVSSRALQQLCLLLLAHLLVLLLNLLLPLLRGKSINTIDPKRQYD